MPGFEKAWFLLPCIGRSLAVRGVGLETIADVTDLDLPRRIFDGTGGVGKRSCCLSALNRRNRAPGWEMLRFAVVFWIPAGAGTTAGDGVHVRHAGESRHPGVLAQTQLLNLKKYNGIQQSKQERIRSVSNSRLSFTRAIADQMLKNCDGVLKME